MIIIFGSRRCGSCRDLNSGWEDEKDPRDFITWPISRYHFEEVNSMESKFNLGAAYDSRLLSS